MYDSVVDDLMRLLGNNFGLNIALLGKIPERM